MKKYNVTCTVIYNGNCVVEADNWDDAIQKADKLLSAGESDLPFIGWYGNVEFEFGGATVDSAEEIEEKKVELLVKPSELKVEQFSCDPCLPGVNDSMELDSGEVMYLKAKYGEYVVEVETKVCGDVRVIFRDEVYRCASKMPSDLLYAYNNGLDPGMVAEADRHVYETPYYCDMNNWFEESVIISRNEEVLERTDNVVDPGKCSVEWWKSASLDEAAQALSDYLSERKETDC